MRGIQRKLVQMIFEDGVFTLKGDNMKGLFLMLMLLSGCSFIRNIPANSTPQRTERYYRAQDIPNAIGGVVADQALHLVFHGPGPCKTVEKRGGKCGMSSPVWRMGTVSALALTRRQLDKGYRESGALFNVIGAMVSEIVWCAASSGCRKPKHIGRFTVHSFVF